MKILVINGPNLNMLGIREPELYGRTTYAVLCALIEDHAEKIGVEVELYQSNHEGDLVDHIQKAYNRIDGIVINPGAYTHTSPAVEVHISEVDKREEFRQISYVRLACIATITGHGIDGYLEAMDILRERYAG